MSNPTPTIRTVNLEWAIRTLARLDGAGMLDDYLHEVAETTRGPHDDLDRWPHHRFQVGRFARMASTLFCVSIGEAHGAACLALLPSTRRGIALEILEEFEQRLEDEALRESSSRAIERARRRRA